jgi:PTS system mannose-specific IIA component
MIGITIVTHRQLGDALIDAAGFILGGKPEAVVSVSIDINEKVDTLQSDVAKAIKKVQQDKGVLVLTDMFGGTPSNLSYSFLEEGKVEVISGVNLPILIKAVGARDKLALTDLAVHLETYGKKSISMASSILKGNKR